MERVEGLRVFNRRGSLQDTAIEVVELRGIGSGIGSALLDYIHFVFLLDIRSDSHFCFGIRQLERALQDRRAMERVEGLRGRVTHEVRSTRTSLESRTRIGGGGRGFRIRRGGGNKEVLRTRLVLTGVINGLVLECILEGHSELDLTIRDLFGEIILTQTKSWKRKKRYREEMVDLP